jgi:GAF domain-containing protein/HAMP domain-containing protein
MGQDGGHSSYADLGVRRRIGKKLAMWVGLSALVLGALVAAVLIPIERQATEETSLDQIGLLAEAVAATYAVIDERHRTHRAEAVIAQVGRAEQVLYVDVSNHTGKVTRSSRPLNVGQQRELSGESLREVSIAAEELMVSLQLPWRQDCVGCHDARHNPVGAITVAVDRRAALSSLERFHALLLIALVVVFVLVVVMLLVTTDRLVSRPVFGLARLMAKAERGDFLVRARYASDDELGALSRAFNSMLKNITELKASEIQREADLEEAQRELELKGKLEEANDALEGANAMLERRVRAQQLLMEAAHRFSSTLDRDQLLDRLQQVIVDKVHMSDFALFLIDEDEDGEAILRVERAHGRPDREEVHNAVFHVGEGITGFVAETGAPLLIDDVAKERDRAGPETRALTEREVTNPGSTKPRDPSGTLVAVPLIHKGRVVGVLTLFHTEIKAFDDDDLELFQALGALAATAVVNADLYNKTLELSITDALTGLMNRRAMERRLEMELIRAQRFSMPLSCAHGRCRPLQELQRPHGPPPRRRGAQGGGLGARWQRAQGRRGGALWGRGVLRVSAPHRRGFGPGRGREAVTTRCARWTGGGRRRPSPSGISRSRWASPSTPRTCRRRSRARLRLRRCSNGPIRPSTRPRAPAATRRWRASGRAGQPSGHALAARAERPGVRRHETLTAVASPEARPQGASSPRIGAHRSALRRRRRVARP